MTDKKTNGEYREFWISWSCTFVKNELTKTTPMIVEDPTKDDLENNGIHVIESRALEAKDKEINRLKEKMKDIKKVLTNLDKVYDDPGIDDVYRRIFIRTSIDSLGDL